MVNSNRLRQIQSVEMSQAERWNLEESVLLWNNGGSTTYRLISVSIHTLQSKLWPSTDLHTGVRVVCFAGEAWWFFKVLKKSAILRTPTPHSTLAPKVILYYKYNSHFSHMALYFDLWVLGNPCLSAFEVIWHWGMRGRGGKGQTERGLRKRKHILQKKDNALVTTQHEWETQFGVWREWKRTWAESFGEIWQEREGEVKRERGWEWGVVEMGERDTLEI